MPKKITKTDFESLIENGEVLENEGQSPKVVRLPEGKIVKLFRRKRLLSSQIWIKHAERFEKNASTLQFKKIRTVQVESVFSIPDIERHGVLYKQLEGETLRKWFAQNTDAAKQKARMQQFGTYTAELHAKGILFRSLHMGNVLVCPDDALGLIDIADISFHPNPLTTSQRIRNLHHMDREDRDRALLAGPTGQDFLQAYLDASQKSERSQKRIAAAFEEIFSPYR